MARVLERTGSTSFFIAEIDSPTLAELRKDSRIKSVYEDTLSRASLDTSTRVVNSVGANAAG